MQIYIFEKYTDRKLVELEANESGANVARRIPHENDLHDVVVLKQDGLFVDHCDPWARCLTLSPEVYSGCNASVAAVAAHEAGHALQHAEGGASLWMRSLMAYPAYVVIAPSEPFVILGLPLAGFKQAMPDSICYYVVFGGAVLFLVCFACSLVRLAAM